MTIEFERKYRKATLELAEVFSWKGKHIPARQRLARKMGLELRPSHYNSFLRNTIQHGIYFSVVMSLFMSYIYRDDADMTGQELLGWSLMSGAFFGLCVAINYRLSFERHKLTAWEEL